MTQVSKGSWNVWWSPRTRCVPSSILPAMQPDHGRAPPTVRQRVSPAVECRQRLFLDGTLGHPSNASQNGPSGFSVGQAIKFTVRRRWRGLLSRADQRGCRRGIFEGMAQVSKAIPAKKQPLVKSLHQRPDAPWRTRDRDIPGWVASPQSPTPFLPVGRV